MRKVSLFAAAAAFILAGVGSWAASTTHARVDAPKTSVTIDTIHLTKIAGKCQWKSSKTIPWCSIDLLLGTNLRS
jgi:hypothetical protein